jgi:dUTP pyrophosphatase
MQVVWRKVMVQAVQVNIKKLRDGAVVPAYGTDFAAGADLYACMDEEIRIAGGETVMIKTGIAMELPEGYAGLIYARSGLATKKGLAPANKVGVVDSDYRGEIMVSLHNHSGETQVVEPGERVAQMIITPYIRGLFNVVDELSDTARGTGGFSSTGRR